AAELERAIGLAGEHLSVYQLTIEENTAFAGAWRRGDFTLPPEETAVRLYEITQSLLAEAGLPGYVTFNHARPGARCPPTLISRQGGDYAGIGPGAHGRLTRAGGRYATRQHRAPEAWLEAVETSGHATRERRPLGAEERRDELLMMGLRLSTGVGRARFKKVV